MPSDENLFEVANTFVDAFLNDETISSHVYAFKVKALLEEISCMEGCPKIVIYVESYKDLQIILGKLKEIFKGFVGVGRGPDFNEATGENNFIYFAQGSRIDKGLWPELYELPNRVYFDENKIRERIGIDALCYSGSNTGDIK